MSVSWLASARRKTGRRKTGLRILVALLVGLTTFSVLGSSPAQAIPICCDDPPPDDCVAASSGTLTVSPGTVMAGQSVTVSWDVDQIPGCTVWKSIDGAGFGGGSVGASGSRTVTLNTQGSTSWALKVSGSAGNVYTLDTTSATVAPPLAALSPLAAARDNDGRLHAIMVRGDDVILRDRQLTANGDFPGWTVAQGLLRSVAAETDGSGRVVEVGFNGNGNVWAAMQSAPGSTSWSGWNLLDGLITSVGLARNGDGRLELVATNVAGTIFHRTQTAVGTLSFTGWAVLPGLLKQVAAETNGDGRIELVGVNTAGQIFHQSQTAANSQTWTGWVQLAGSLNSIAIARNAGNTLEIFGTDGSGALRAANQTSAGGAAWDALFTIPDGQGGQVAAETNADGRVEVFGRDSAGVMSFRTQTGPGSLSFTGWLPLSQDVPQPAPIGNPRNVTVVPVNWVGTASTPASPQTKTLDEITALIDPMLWSEFSYGHWAGWTIAGHAPLTIPAPRVGPSGLCDKRFLDDVTASVGAAGITTAGPDPVVYYYTAIPGCGFSGYAIGNGVFINGSDRSTMTQELGHILGLPHAHSKICENPPTVMVPLSNSCATIEYGDPNDVMATGGAGFNAMERQRLGWFAGRLVDVPTDGGTFTIAPLELMAPSAPQALRLNDGTTLWIEYRQPIGLDTRALNSPGVLIYQQPNSALESSILDMTPGATGYNLPIGSTFVNPLGAKKITVNWANSTGASITIAPTIPPVQVPYLIDDTCGQAITELQAVGLNGTCWGEGNFVGNTSPGGGSWVPPGTTVSLQMVINAP
jgi:hypothetical protein